MKMELISFFSQSLVIILVLMISSFLIIWKTTNSKKKNKFQTCSDRSAPPPPQPPKLPIIGNLHQLICLLPHRRLAELARIYGPLMKLQLGQVSAVVVSSPEVAKQVMKHNDTKFTERSRVSVTDIIFYNRKDIAFAPNGEYWRQMRKICTVELFSSKRVQSFRSIREQEILDFTTSIHNKLGSEINFSQMIFSLTNSVLTRTVIGRRKNQNQEADLQVICRLDKAIAGFTALDMFPSLGFIHVITGMKSSILKLHKEADQLLENIINEQKQDMKLEDNNNNLLNVLLNHQADHPDSLLTTDSIKAITLEMLIAGTDSSATLFEWVMSELMKNPKVMKKAQVEVRKLCGENRKLDESVMNELSFLKAVIKETLRLHPPVPLIPRQCREECEVNGYNIKPKTEVFVNLWAIGRDPNHWTEPEKFNPERFVGSAIDYQGCNFEYIPFGAGRRVCPGIELGVTNVEFAVAKTLYHFDWELPNQMKPEELDMTEAFGLGVRRKNHLYLIPVAPFLA